MSARIDITKHKIMSMDSGKRERIINAAMAEFSKGFKSASTDAIVREAGISKGLLFHYFGTKERLYEFLIWYALDVMVAEYFGLINTGQSDLLERLWQAVLLKMDLSYKYPAVFEFLAAAYANAKDDPSDEFAAQFKNMRNTTSSIIYENIDEALFREGIDVKKAASIIWWTLAGYSESQIGSGKTLDEYQREYERYLADIKEYFELFRKIFYK